MPRMRGRVSTLRSVQRYRNSADGTRSPLAKVHKQPYANSRELLTLALALVLVFGLAFTEFILRH